ncbi:hypothetical protein [Desulfocastanea catecholica]
MLTEMSYNVAQKGVFTMATNTTVRARIDGKLKNGAERQNGVGKTKEWWGQIFILDI